MVFKCIFLILAICPFLLSIWPDTNRGAQEFRDSNWKYLFERLNLISFLLKLSLFLLAKCFPYRECTSSFGLSSRVQLPLLSSGWSGEICRSNKCSVG